MQRQNDDERGQNYEDDGNDILGPPVNFSTAGNGKVFLQMKSVLQIYSNHLMMGQSIYLRQYPGHEIGKSFRRFVSKWFDTHNWLKYHFGIVEKRSEQFTQTDFRAWNRCHGDDPKTNAFISIKILIYTALQ